MDNNLQDRLTDRFEFLRGTDYGFDVGNGWYQLLWNMAEELEVILTQSAIAPAIHMHQIKEKYGALSVIYSISWPKAPSLSIKEAQSAANQRKQREETLRRIDATVSSYEDKSTTICEVCGAENSTHRGDLAYQLTLCDKHYLEEKDR